MPKKYQVQVIAAKNDTEQNEILVHGPIGASFWDDSGISGKDFTDALNQFPKGKKVTIGVNSQGGAVGEGLAIYNAIQRRAEDITVRIDGYAISIASVFPLAASKVISPKSSIWMIHNAWSFAQGSADEMRKQADVLDTHDSTLVGIYSEKTGKSRKEIESAMAEETWFNGEEAVKWGLADESNDDDTSAALDAIDFRSAPQGTFKNLPVALGGAGRTTKQPQTQTPVASLGGKPHNTMDKTKIVALLESHGIDASIDETIEALEAKLQTALAKKQEPAKNEPAPKTDDAVSAELKQIRADLVGEQIDKLIGEGKVDAAERDSEIALCVSDKNRVKNVLAKREAKLPGTEPSGAILQSFGNPTIEAYRKIKAGAARKEWFAQNGDGLRKAMKQFTAPQNSNTVDSALVTDRLEDGLIVVAPNKLAMVGAFSRDFSIDPVKPLATIQVKKATAGATAQEDPTDFEATPDSTLDNIPVTMHQQSLTFHVSNTDMLNGIRLTDLSEINADTYCNHISDKITAVITTANFGTALTIGTAANFDAEALSPILAVAKNYRRKNLILDGGHLAYITPKTTEQLNWKTSGAFGFDLIAENNRWTNATANTAGLICSPDSIGIASGMAPELPSGEYLSISNVTLQNGITVRVSTWFSKQYRKWFTCFDLMLGVAPGDTTQAEVLITA